MTVAVAVALLLCTGTARAQDVESQGAGPAEVRVLSLQDCLDIARVENIGLKRTQLGFDVSLLDRMRAASVFDPGFEADFSGKYMPSDSSGIGGTTQYDLGLSYRMPTWDGGSWVFSLDQARANGATTVGGSPTSYTAYSSSLGLTYAMPLLEGRGERINRIGVNKADLAVARSEAAINDAARSLRLGVIQAYISAVLAARAIDVARVSLDTATNLVEETQARIDVGQLAPYELLSSQAGLAEREESLLNAQASLKIALDSLKELIGLPLTDEIEIDPGTLSSVVMDVNVDDLFLQAQKNRPDLRQLDLQISQAQLDLLLAEDRRQASLSWNTTLSVSGKGDGYSGSFPDADDLSWFTGLQYSLPLGGNRAAEADVGTVNIALENLQLQRVDFLRTLQRDIRAAVEDLNNAMLRIDVTSQGLDVQEVKMESERARLELGLITSRDMLEFDLDYANARLAYDRALSDAMLAVARIESLINQEMLNDAIAIGGANAGGGGS
jgi:outer membrane protein TolC